MSGVTTSAGENNRDEREVEKRRESEYLSQNPDAAAAEVASALTKKGIQIILASVYNLRTSTRKAGKTSIVPEMRNTLFSAQLGGILTEVIQRD